MTVVKTWMAERQRRARPELLAQAGRRKGVDCYKVHALMEMELLQIDTGKLKPDGHCTKQKSFRPPRASEDRLPQTSA